MVMQLLTLGRDPAITSAFLAQLDAIRPDTYPAFCAHSPDEFRSLAFLHKENINLILLGAAQADQDAERAQGIVNGVWGEQKMRILRLPGALLTEEGKNGGMVEWFLQQVEGKGKAGNGKSK